MTISTPLEPLHRRLGARMVTFAGYSMPISYPGGIVAEHLACRTGAGLFDVSHMGQASVAGPNAAAWLETLMPADVVGLTVGQQRYSFLTNDDGGIVDDLMVARIGPETFTLVVNASCKQEDWSLLRAKLTGGVVLEVHEERALLAVQGPGAAALVPALADVPFMGVRTAEIAGCACVASRSGYTGEDGFEISCHGEDALTVAEHLLTGPSCSPIGLGARDSLRLEAGLCLYGADIDTGTNPVEAGLTWAIGKRRRAQGGYPGAEAVGAAMRDGTARLRVGIRTDGRAPARAHAPIVDATGARIGTVTSGGFGPSLGAPVAMGYVARAYAAVGTEVRLMVRDKALDARIVPMPFVPHRYRR